MSNNNNFSVIYFSIFTPEIFQAKLNNHFIKKKDTRKSFSNFKTTNNILIKKIKANSISQKKHLFCKTTANIKNKNVLVFRDFISVKKNNKKKNKSKTKYKIIQSVGRPGSAEPYKQYILEKREIEENRKRRDIEKKYVIESRKQQELKLLNDIKTKYEGYDISRQEAKVGFMDK